MCWTLLLIYCSVRNLSEVGNFLIYKLEMFKICFDINSTSLGTSENQATSVLALRYSKTVNSEQVQALANSLPMLTWYGQCSVDSHIFYKRITKEAEYFDLVSNLDSHVQSESSKDDNVDWN